MFQKLFRKKNVQQILNDLDARESHHAGLNKTLSVRDLTAFGIAAIIGAGIFSTIGKASADGGPAVIYLFLFTAIACSFAAFAYAEFASMVPVSGSAYTYSYVAFGELIAWIIGWSLIMEYGIGNITVAISWSDYFTGFLGSTGLHLPEWMTMDYLSANRGYHDAVKLLESGRLFENLDSSMQSAYLAWQNAPNILGFHLVLDLPALFIIILITWLVYRGMKESRNASNAMVIVKLAIILLVIAVGIFYVDVENWNPFAPNGIGGILKGVSAVFFAYIGFDAISTTAEECKNPQRDLPRSMMWAIIICTLLYITIALVLTGMVKYDQLAVGDPLAFVFEKLNLKWLSGIIAVSAIVAMASVLLVFQMGQPRIWMSMSRDGLLPKAFSRIHPVHKTPSFATIVTGFVVAVPSLFMNLTIVTDLCSIGTLFAFVLVCAGVLRLQNDTTVQRGKFKTPYLNSKFIYPAMLLLGILYLFNFQQESAMAFVKNTPKVFPMEDIITSMSIEEVNVVKVESIKKDSANFALHNNDLLQYLNSFNETDAASILLSNSISETKVYESGWALFKHKIPMWIFFFVCIVLAYYAFRYNLSMIPLMGLLSCLYMMSELGVSNWIGFGIWLVIGLVIYFSYGYRKSRLVISD
jgi:basic amino acid/polyamine antiporter, APA family